MCPQDKKCELRIDMSFPVGKYQAIYQRFSVGDQASGYLLTLSGYSGNTRDAMSLHHLSMFSTYDRYVANVRQCKQNNQIHGGFWYYSYNEVKAIIRRNNISLTKSKGCQEANLNGKWASDKEYGIHWKPLTFNKNNKYLTSTEMKLRVL